MGTGRIRREDKVMGERESRQFRIDDPLARF